jgi:lipopolysaccharide transport system ATP-binding protein
MEVIRCDDVGKRYQIGSRDRYATLRDTIVSAARAPLDRLRNVRRVDDSFIWSLRDVTFSVSEGELVGVIGRNGAGKSTLLRILAGITEPSAGRAAVRGRVGSLLEVGTGFHPELTGRENIYLSGAILGMNRAEIRRRFDDIVSFAEVERFLETPVKRFSSGMHMRLAFAVAAHLETEILLVDEVLAVGDAAFQRRCIDVMGALANGRRTVVFVSHDLGAVQRLCHRTLLLDGGRVVADGRTADVVVGYLSSAGLQATPTVDVDLGAASRRGTGEARFSTMRFSCPDAGMGGFPFTDGPLDVSVAVECSEPITVGCIELFIRDHRGVKLIDADSALLGQSFRLEVGTNRFTFRIESLPLNPGIYHLGLWMARDAQDGAGVDHVDPAAQVEVLSRDPSRLIGYSAAYGPVACRFDVVREAPVHA